MWVWVVDEDKNSLLLEYVDKSKGGDFLFKKKIYNESVFKLYEK